MEFAFDQKKSELLYKIRGINFPMVIEAIAENGILLQFDHPNKEKYPNQRVFVVEINGYSYCIPYVIEGETWFLKTIYPSRKFKYLISGGNYE